MAQSSPGSEPFPALDNQPQNHAVPTDAHRSRNRGTSKSSLGDLVRRLSREFEDSQVPEGFSAATGDIASTVVSAMDRGKTRTLPTGLDRTNDVDVAKTRSGDARAATGSPLPSSPSSEGATVTAVDNSDDPASIGLTKPFENGYHFPPKYTWQESTRHGLAAFWRFFITPMGFFWTIYGLNVVAWGGMIFLLLCNAAPAMCYPDCNHIDSPRRKWIEWDAQILTVLFCVTAFGFAPWRFRDLWYLLKYRISGQFSGLQRLAGIHNSWFRLRGSQELAVDIGPDHIPEGVAADAIPIPTKLTPTPPLTGARAPPTAVWKMDLMIWSMVLNTLAQIGLCGIMWGMNRYDRPSWATGFLVAVGMVIAMVGGYVTFVEGKRVKSIEGVPLTDKDHERLAQDREKGILHYNNLKGKKPKRKKKDKDLEKGLDKAAQE